MDSAGAAGPSQLVEGSIPLGSAPGTELESPLGGLSSVAKLSRKRARGACGDGASAAGPSGQAQVEALAAGDDVPGPADSVGVEAVPSVIMQAPRIADTMLAPLSSLDTGNILKKFEVMKSLSEWPSLAGSYDFALSGSLIPEGYGQLGDSDAPAFANILM